MKLESLNSERFKKIGNDEMGKVYGGLRTLTISPPTFTITCKKDTKDPCEQDPDTDDPDDNNL